MKYLLILIAVAPLICSAQTQSIDDLMAKDKMIEDLKIFRDIRESVNSGVYKYRSEREIDSIYHWAFKEIEDSRTILDFYNIISKITDFEGSLHNETNFPSDLTTSLYKENKGYFPFSIKIIEDNIIFNNAEQVIPLGAIITSINGAQSSRIVNDLGKYWTSDGYTKSSKVDGINFDFAKFLRFQYGQVDTFEVKYRSNKSETEEKNITLKSSSLKDYFSSYRKRHSVVFDSIYYNIGYELRTSTQGAYSFKILEDSIGYLYINHFLIGKDEKDKLHKKYASFLEKTFTQIKNESIKNLIVDVRTNTGGTGPNDILTYSYLTQKTVQNAKTAWVKKRKLPYSKYLDFPKLLKPFARWKINRELKKEFTLQKDNGYYYEKFEDVKPKENAFDGQIYLLIGAPTASAGSLFAAMVSGNTNAIVIGEETNGGYYGHNGILPISYQLPNSKIITTFSIVNIDQNVPLKDNQPKGRGIIPDHYVTQSYEDFMDNADTQLEFTIRFIQKNRKEHDC